MGTGLGCGQALGGLSLTLGIGEVGTERVGHRGWGQMRPRGSQEMQVRWSVPCLPWPRDVPSWEQVVSGSHGQPGGGRALTSPELASTAQQGDTDRQKASWAQDPQEA